MCWMRKSDDARARKAPNRWLALGAMFAGASGAAAGLLQRYTPLNADWVDGIHGMLVGMAIGLIAVGFKRAKR